jgi:trimethylamine:corrinoid methyltransferase-like protein
MHASLLGFSLESLVIDNDALGAVNRTVRGIEVDADTLSVAVIRDVCLNGPGHYLGHAQTLARMQRSLGERAVQLIEQMNQGPGEDVELPVGGPTEPEEGQP